MKTTPISQLQDTLHHIAQLNNHDLLQENANVDGNSPMGQMSRFASESARYYAHQFLLSANVKKAIDENFIYPHDLDFLASGTTTCCQIPLGRLLRGGFHTGHGFIREPQDIMSAMSLASIVFQANQNMQHGGQSFPMFDYDLAPYVHKTYLKHLKRLKTYPLPITANELDDLAWTETERTTYQACEAFIHNANSMHSRGGGQVPFVSINYGTDTSKEGRMLIKNILKATQAGLGHGETSIFPIQVFKMKEGINVYECDPNYDLYQLALETTAKRLFPNFSFIDSPVNKPFYDGTPESEVAYMGCRTRVMSNVHGKQNSVGRGNLSFTSINLVRIALLSADINSFFALLEHYIDLTIQQLLERYHLQCKKHVKNFLFLYSQGIWHESEQLTENDTLQDVLKHGTLSVGFIGLAEALVALTGKHHGECEQAFFLGKRIIQFLREKTDQATVTHHLNISLVATPAEGLSGKFVQKDRDEFGVLSDITDRAYYTNSFHIPVHYTIKAADKIRIEAPFHTMCNGGHISYIELDGHASRNTIAIDTLIQAMRTAGMGYVSINHPLDRCKTCGYIGVIDNACPKCNNNLEEAIERIRRITGYLVGDVRRWNTAKRQEEQDRVTHI
ncbi:anaerobic ribonucleoside triphosphate reductase [Shouchella lonarensis]|uniref:Ribonucleoside-triphosphate reductase class III catalytic subunit n=1 Tax=Shouchella lonarensis TaxID=1464122 RepID=A0A1G6N359_9BACI|nr:anaerobic ribonucleoside triphosphate reductase [Shouchella lonarensis]SDC62131.1 ribonucleoside-triphosphate reductase class III catalytic subunit [Shouchella lonarensis]